MSEVAYQKEVLGEGQRLQTSKARIACVGVGYWGKNLLRNLGELDVLAAICESDVSKHPQLSREHPDTPVTHRYEELLRNPEIDAVAIATPAATHAAVVRLALEAGKDVFVEKPLCLSAKEGEELVTFAEKQKRILMVGHLLWYHPAVLKLKELVDSGELGQVQYIYSNRLNLGKIRREENILWSFAPHDISVILGLLGETPDYIQAQGGSFVHPDNADVTISLLSFPSGVKAHLFVSWLHPFKEQKLIVVGSRKMAVFNDLEPLDKLVVYPHTIEWKNRLPVAMKADAEVIPFEWTEPLRNELAHFAECVRTRNRPRTDGEEGLRVLRVLEQSQEALVQNAPVRPVAVSVPVPNGKRYFAHESAFIDEDVEIGEGTKVWHVSHIMRGSKIGERCNIGQNVVIGPNAVVGNGVKIQNNVSVYEGVVLEDHVFCGPSMVFTNVVNPRSEVIRRDEFRKTVVKRGASLGANCTIVCGVTVGRYAFVGAGAVVTKDVPDYAMVVGVPARIVGWMSECGEKLELLADEESASCAKCGKRYRRAADGGLTPDVERDRRLPNLSSLDESPDHRSCIE